MIYFFFQQSVRSGARRICRRCPSPTSSGAKELRVRESFNLCAAGWFLFVFFNTCLLFTLLLTIVLFFHIPVRKGFWTEPRNVRKRLEEFAREMGFDPHIASNWVSVSGRKIEKLKVTDIRRTRSTSLSLSLLSSLSLSLSFSLSLSTPRAHGVLTKASG